MNERLKRITDLFVEGTELYLGDDEAGPILIWINKLNSFETDDVRRDAMVRRGERLAELGQEDSPERAGVLAEMRLWDYPRLVEEFLATKSDERYLTAMDDLQADKTWRELTERLQRAPMLHEIEELPADDPRRTALEEDNRLYESRIREAVQKLEEQAREDLAGADRDDVEKSFLEQWRQRQTLNEFMAARRYAEMYYSMRQCQGVKGELKATGGWSFSHKDCDHAKRYLDDRRQVRDLPEHVITLVIDAMDEVRINDREAGNSDAPSSSSGSLEQSSASEEASNPSSQEETPSAAPTT